MCMLVMSYEMILKCAKSAIIEAPEQKRCGFSIRRWYNLSDTDWTSCVPIPSYSSKAIYRLITRDEHKVGFCGFSHSYTDWIFWYHLTAKPSVSPLLDIISFGDDDTYRSHLQKRRFVSQWICPSMEAKLKILLRHPVQKSGLTLWEPWIQNGHNWSYYQLFSGLAYNAV